MLTCVLKTKWVRECIRKSWYGDNKFSRWEIGCCKTGYSDCVRLLFFPVIQRGNNFSMTFKRCLWWRHRYNLRFFVDIHHLWFFLRIIIINIIMTRNRKKIVHDIVAWQRREEGDRTKKVTKSEKPNQNFILRIRGTEEDEKWVGEEGNNDGEKGEKNKQMGSNPNNSKKIF